MVKFRPESVSVAAVQVAGAGDRQPTSVNEDAAKADATRAPARTVVLAVPVADINKLTLGAACRSADAGPAQSQRRMIVPSESLFPAPPPLFYRHGGFKPGSTDAASGKVLDRQHWPASQ